MLNDLIFVGGQFLHPLAQFIDAHNQIDRLNFTDLRKFYDLQFELLRNNFMPRLNKIGTKKTVIFASAFYNSGLRNFDFNNKTQPEIDDFLTIRVDYNNKLRRLVDQYENLVFFEASDASAHPVNGQGLLGDDIHKFKGRGDPDREVPPSLYADIQFLYNYVCNKQLYPNDEKYCCS